MLNIGVPQRVLDVKSACSIGLSPTVPTGIRLMVNCDAIEVVDGVGSISLY